jgi:hypothetical protein
LGKASICCDWLGSDEVRDAGVVIWKASSPGTTLSPGDSSKVGDGDLTVLADGFTTLATWSCNAKECVTQSHARRVQIRHTDVGKYANYLRPRCCCPTGSARLTSLPSWPWLCSHLERRDRTRPDIRGIHVPTSYSCHKLAASRRTVHG